MSRKTHGRSHGSRGSDPVLAVWHTLDLSGGDWTNVGGDYPNSRYRFLAEIDGDQEPAVELEVYVTGGTAGSVIGNIGVTYAKNHPPFFVPDGSGDPHAITLLANGDIQDGVA